MAASLGVDASLIRLDSAQGGVGAWDSLGQVHLMVAVEEAFDVQLEVEDFARLTSVRAILDYLKSQGIE
jgi:acyl carrier protein